MYSGGETEKPVKVALSAHSVIALITNTTTTSKKHCMTLQMRLVSGAFSHLVSAPLWPTRLSQCPGASGTGG